MKKLIPVLFLTAVLTFGASQVLAGETPSSIPQKPSKEQCLKQKQTFEQRLNLTEKQKEKAKKIHQKGAKQMKPLMEKRMSLRNEIAQIKKSESDECAKKEQIDKKVKELKALDKKANEIRKSNSQEFEKILTKEQKTELEKMKAEGRKNFEKHHPPRPPFNMFPPPEFKRGEKGIFPPPPPPRFEK